MDGLGGSQHWVLTGRSPRYVSTTLSNGSEFAPAHFASCLDSGRYRLPAVRHFRLTRPVSAPSLPAATGVDREWRRAGFPALPSPSPSLPVPPLATARRGDSRPGLGVSAGALSSLRRRGREGGRPRPSVPAPRHRARRRHGHEADAAHLLGPHAARGGFGLQRHHALRLLSDQRLQRWQTYAPPGRYRRLDRNIFGS